MMAHRRKNERFCAIALCVVAAEGLQRNAAREAGSQPPDAISHHTTDASSDASARLRTSHKALSLAAAASHTAAETRSRRAAR